MKTLADFATHTRTWSEYTLEAHVEVIGWGKTHLGRTEYVIGRDEAAVAAHAAKFPKSHAMKVGQLFAAAPFCNNNGQQVGNGPRKELDTKDVTCIKCRRWVG